MAQRRSRVVGVNTLRRKLRRMEPAVQQEVRNAVADVANRIQRDAMSLAPVDQGDLRESIDVKFGRDRLTALVGPGIRAAEIVRQKSGSVFGQVHRRGKSKGQAIRLSKRNRHAWFQMWKGYWIEFGTKGHPARKKHRGGREIGTLRAVPARPPRPFMRPAFDRNRLWAMRRMRTAVNRALERASRG